jgi:hypothetical protein|tara:strand:- start:56 stop:229 length:174 start_codon:yes stop_codon:yes gene_type:complete
MAGKAKSCYLSVADKSTNKNVFRRVFFRMADLNDFVKTDEFKAKYPQEQFQVIKEVY